MNQENIKARLSGMGNDFASFDDLAAVAAEMREQASDVVTDCELVFLYDECAARIESFLAMAQPGVSRIEEVIAAILMTTKRLDAEIMHGDQGGLQ